MEGFPGQRMTSPGDVLVELWVHIDIRNNKYITITDRGYNGCLVIVG